MSKLPYGGDRKAETSARVERVAGFKSGGAVKDGNTSIHINVGAPTPTTPKPPVMAPPPMPAMGGPPPPPMGGPPMMGMKRGGRTGASDDPGC